MATSLRPCPVCRRPMDVSRSVCTYCAAAGTPAPEETTTPTEAPQPQAPLSTQEKIEITGQVFLVLGCLIPGLLFSLFIGWVLFMVVSGTGR